MNKYKPVNGLVLLKPLKLKYNVEIQTAVDVDAAKGLDPAKDEMPTKETEVKTLLRQQLAEVIDIGTIDAEKIGYGPGDIVVYNYTMASDFELQKGYKITNSFNIIAKKVQ